MTAAGSDSQGNDRQPEDARSFEEALEALETIVTRLEGGDMGLDASLKLFEDGVALARICAKRLDQAERKIELLLEKNGDVVLMSAPDLETASGSTADSHDG
ncbi:MAG: exodeoxyribonuclease VII small subunit [Thermaerobacterales bacterium]